MMLTESIHRIFSGRRGAGQMAAGGVPIPTGFRNVLDGKHSRTRFWMPFVLLFFLLPACQNEVLPPEVDFPEGLIYQVRVGDTLFVTPICSHTDEHTLYQWRLNGEIILENLVLQFVPTEAGRFYLNLGVENAGGECQAEIRVDVAERQAPAVSLPYAREGLTIAQGDSLCLRPLIESALPCRYQWTLDGVVVSDDSCLWFPTAEPGCFDVEFLAENADGSDRLHFTVQVRTADEIPLSWYLPQNGFSLSLGRRIRLCPLDLPQVENLFFRWSINGRTVQEGPDAALIFEAVTPGSFSLCLEMSHGRDTLRWSPEIRVSAETFRRLPSAESRPTATQVFRYLPAPGQFINDGYDCRTMEEACSYAENRLKNKELISLGGFGGYLVVGFDHSVVNGGDYDLAIRGNAFSHASEPAIVWVMQDENGNGLPDDTWYELKGSEYGKEGSLSDYVVRYYRPVSDKRSVPWTDSEGRQGVVPYLEAYHKQDSYYPAWVQEDSYLLYGSRLGAKNHPSDAGGFLWTNEDYEWGYADNYSLIDMMTSDGKMSGENHFRISDAVGFDGQPIDLPFIDFVKAQSAVQTVSGWLGEISPEIISITDVHLSD